MKKLLLVGAAALAHVIGYTVCGHVINDKGSW